MPLQGIGIPTGLKLNQANFDQNGPGCQLRLRGFPQAILLPEIDRQVQ